MTNGLSEQHARNLERRLEWTDQWAEIVASVEGDSEWEKNVIDSSMR